MTKDDHNEVVTDEVVLLKKIPLPSIVYSGNKEKQTSTMKVLAVFMIKKPIVVGIQLNGSLSIGNIVTTDDDVDIGVIIRIHDGIQHVESISGNNMDVCIWIQSSTGIIESEFVGIQLKTFE